MTTDFEKSSRNRNMVFGAAAVALIGVGGYLTWKYALDEPKTLSEAGEGFGELWEKGKDEVSSWDFGNFTNVLDGLDDLSFGDLFDEDPNKGYNGTLIIWDDEFVKENDGGLHLTLQNALDDTWQEEFAIAVADWQESEALQLTPVKVEVDHECNRVEGVMVVCNANFGATGWVGINENRMVNKRITSSVSKMNEYYLRNANFDHRRFTMCHELGHGFGLPHTDENPYNKNLGNCLDYTDDPDENLLPGDVNMVKLKTMYLSRRRLRKRVVQEDGSIIETIEVMANEMDSAVDDAEEVGSNANKKLM